MTRGLIIVVGLLITMACSKTTDNITRPDPPPPSGPPIETEATLTPDRQYVYYVHTDTAYPDNNGVYRVSAANPVPYPIITGHTVNSPSTAGLGFVLAYIENDSLWYWGPLNDSVTFSGVDTVLERVFFIEGSLVIGYRNGRIYVLPNFSNQASFHRTGTAPGPHTSGTFVWLRDKPGPEVSIMISRLQPIEDSVLISFDLSAPVQRISHFPSSNRAILVTGSGPYSIQALDLTNGQPTTLTTSQYPTGLMTAYDEVVYTGDDGELWRCDFDGGNKREWRGSDVP